MPHECVKCGEPTVLLLSSLCEECYLKKAKKRYNRVRFRERPKCREAVNKLLTTMTLFQIAFWFEYDTVPVVPSEGLKLQARKMLKENGKL